MLTKTSYRFALTFVFLLFARSVFADGALDFADPCKKAEKQFASGAEAANAQADAIITDWDTKKEPPKEFYTLYVEAIQTEALKQWKETQTAKLLLNELKKQPGFDEKKYFIANVYPSIVTKEEEKKLVMEIYKVDYKAKIRPKLLSERKDLDNQIQQQRTELDKSCKNDEVSKLLRATLGNGISLINGNFEAAKNESGEIAKLVRATSGISLTDIAKNGLAGGEGSEMNKLLKSLGAGPGSDLQKAVEYVAAALNPVNWWKINTPIIIDECWGEEDCRGKKEGIIRGCILTFWGC